MKNKYNLVYKHFLSPEHFFKYVKIMMTYKGPMWVPHGLKFLYGTHMGPIWASCPDSAHMGPICPCVLGSCSGSIYMKGMKIKQNSVHFQKLKSRKKKTLPYIRFGFKCVVIRGNREANQCLCFRYTDSTIPLLPIYEISSL